MNAQAKYLMVAALLGALAVIVGAFGAHGLEDILSEDMREVYETGVTYHFYHALAMLALAAGSATLWTSPLCLWACRAWTLGIVVFSGSLYALALTEISWLGAITPIGGVGMIAGWILVAMAAFKSRATA